MSIAATLRKTTTATYVNFDYFYTMKVLDTFAGAGGFSLGFHLTGHYEIIGAIEFDQWAADTFKFNHPDSTVSF